MRSPRVSRQAPAVESAEPSSSEEDRDEVPLEQTTALVLQLAQSRLSEAQLAVQLRQTELDNLKAALSTRYGEGGKYVVTGVNYPKMVIERTVVK